MRNRFLPLCALLVLGPVAAGGAFRLALPGYQYQFPRDHFSHPEFRTEWWYYTGNLRSADGRKFGFELTFFRHALEPELPAGANVWDIRDVWMAHLALSDIDRGKFVSTERIIEAAQVSPGSMRLGELYGTGTGVSNGPTIRTSIWLPSGTISHTT